MVWGNGSDDRERVARRRDLFSTSARDRTRLAALPRLHSGRTDRGHKPGPRSATRSPGRLPTARPASQVLGQPVQDHDAGDGGTERRDQDVRCCCGNRQGCCQSRLAPGKSDAERWSTLRLRFVRCALAAPSTMSSRSPARNRPGSWLCRTWTRATAAWGCRTCSPLVAPGAASVCINPDADGRAPRERDDESQVILQGRAS